MVRHAGASMGVEHGAVSNLGYRRKKFGSSRTRASFSSRLFGEQVPRRFARLLRFRVKVRNP